MSNSSTSSLPVLVAGGGIGGVAAALALTRQGFAVKVLEQAPRAEDLLKNRQQFQMDVEHLPCFTDYFYKCSFINCTSLT